MDWWTDGLAGTLEFRRGFLYECDLKKADNPFKKKRRTVIRSNGNDADVKFCDFPNRENANLRNGSYTLKKIQGAVAKRLSKQWWCAQKNKKNKKNKKKEKKKKKNQAHFSRDETHFLIDRAHLKLSRASHYLCSHDYKMTLEMAKKAV